MTLTLEQNQGVDSHPFKLLSTNLARDSSAHSGAHELIAVETRHHLTGVFSLIGEADNPENAPEAADLNARVLALTEGHHIFDPTADFEVAVGRETDTARADVERVSRPGDSLSSELGNLNG